MAVRRLSTTALRPCPSARHRVIPGGVIPHRTSMTDRAWSAIIVISFRRIRSGGRILASGPARSVGEGCVLARCEVVLRHCGCTGARNEVLFRDGMTSTRPLNGMDWKKEVAEGRKGGGGVGCRMDGEPEGDALADDGELITDPVADPVG